MATVTSINSALSSDERAARSEQQERASVAATQTPFDRLPDASTDEPKHALVVTWLQRALERISKSIGTHHLLKLAAARGRFSQSLDEVPQRMQRLAQQTKLVLELVDDFNSGRYRQLPWRSIAVVAAAVLYAVSPGDVVPDFIPGLGAIDDLLIVAVATRIVRKDLEAYCQFKGYALSDYFA